MLGAQDMSVADQISEALAVTGEVPEARDRLTVTAEMQAVCAGELAVATYYNDEELARRTWEHAVAGLDGSLNPIAVDVDCEVWS
jgi:hypothetical protein